MRILTIANHTGSVGGLERSQLEICRGLAAAGHKVTLLYVHRGDLLSLWDAAGVHLRHVGGTLPRRKNVIRSSVGVARAMLAGISAHPDLVYVHRYWDVPFGVALSGVLRRPLLFHLHLPPPDNPPKWLRDALARVDRAIAVSQHTGRLWAEGHVKTDRIAVAMNGVDSGWYRPSSEQEWRAARRDFGLDEGAFVVGYAGRIDESKGVHVLLDAFGAMRVHGAALQLVVAGGTGANGDPSYEETLKRRAAKVGARWLGHQDDVRRVYWACDVVAIPSIWPEPQGLVALEALATGTAVVASNVGGLPEIFQGPLAACLVAPGSVPQLSERLTAFYAERERTAQVGSMGRREVGEQLTWEKTVRAVEDEMALICRKPVRNATPLT